MPPSDVGGIRVGVPLGSIVAIWVGRMMFMMGVPAGVGGLRADWERTWPPGAAIRRWPWAAAAAAARENARVAAVNGRVKDRKRENKRHGERSNGRERAIGEVGCVNVYKICRAEGGIQKWTEGTKQMCEKHRQGKEKRSTQKEGKRGWGEK